MEVYPVPTDVACAALQDRMESAVADAAEREEGGAHLFLSLFFLYP